PADPGTGDSTVWLYDEATGLLTNKVYADGTGPGYAYTVDGKLSLRTWARGETTTYSYNPDTRDMTNIHYSATNAPDVSFSLDRIGRRTQINDGAGTWSFGYNQQLQLTNETLTGSQNRRLVRKYASTGVVGRPTGFTLDTGYDTTWEYSDVGRFNGISWTNTGFSTARVQYWFVTNSDLVAGWQLHGEEAATATNILTREYEGQRDLLKNITVTCFGSSAPWAEFRYTNDAAGRRASVEYYGLLQDEGDATNRIQWLYNLRSELTNTVQQKASSTNRWGYQFDSIGNRAWSTNANERSRTYLANMLNQYTNIVAAATNRLLYDLDGNLTNDGVWAYSWDGENRLRAVAPVSPTNGAKRIEMGYDWQGRRNVKIVSTYSGGWSVTGTNRFTYDGWNMVSETRTGSGTVTNEYLWGLDLSGTLQGAGGIGGLLAFTRTGSPFRETVFSDANGNVIKTAIKAIDHSSIEYDSFGNTIDTYQSMPAGDYPAFRFSSKYLDEETGLYYYGSRFYNSGLGRWINRDPIGERGGRNLCGFVRNAPTYVVDILGLDELVMEATFKCRGCEVQMVIAHAIFVETDWLSPNDELHIPGNFVSRKDGTYFVCNGNAVSLKELVGAVEDGGFDTETEWEAWIAQL
ncbi:MAG: RHS repeat-associated core domain-containing protein, partial [Planctomycetota bacterium]